MLHLRLRGTYDLAAASPMRLPVHVHAAGTAVTRNLLRQDFRLTPSCPIQVLEYGQPTLVDGVRVTAIPANHCPGACMFLFEVPDQGNGGGSAGGTGLGSALRERKLSHGGSSSSGRGVGRAARSGDGVGSGKGSAGSGNVVSGAASRKASGGGGGGRDRGVADRGPGATVEAGGGYGGGGGGVQVILHTGDCRCGHAKSVKPFTDAPLTRLTIHGALLH